MRLQDMYETAFRAGIKADPRGEDRIKSLLDRVRKEYDGLAEDKRWEFDAERLTNPFADTRILVGTPDTEVKTVLVGIDMEVGELLLADALRRQGRTVDLLLAHHPEGRALARIDEVMGVQADIWRDFGVSIAYGDAILSERMAEIMRAVHPRNNERAIAAARLLGFPFMCCHTPADNSVQAFLTEKCGELDTEGTVDELVDFLKTIPEYREGVIHGMGPTIFEGNGSRRTGKIMVDMTGGTSGPVDSIAKLAAAGVGTILGMHMGEDHRKKAKEEKISVVIAGHASSDSLGMNLIIDEYERQGVEVIACSGFTRVSRV
ncbi:MAG: NGG1p interacting factor NIF3 [Actinobacteria bacterium]|nr:NGG1p interacting factor NIF3 [Actinomycetota bacterium]MCL5735585.1 NGG1p interacting factor NIF3 [Actinomycetota bacterium]